MDRKEFIAKGGMASGALLIGGFKVSASSYRDPIWAMIEIDGQGKINLKGKKTVFVGSSPEELGVSQMDYIYPIVPVISDRKI